jgi:hypothetical protein
MTKFKHVLLVALALLAVTPVLQAQSGANLAPADAGVFIQVDGLANWRLDLDQDPIFNILRPHLPDPSQNEVWQNLQTALGMTGGELFDHYFGKSVVLVGSAAGDGKPGVIFSRIDKADGQLVIDRLQLQETDTIGDFKVYVSPDGNAHLAFSDQWMMGSNAQSLPYALTVLKQIGSGKSLANDAGFKTWTGKLPAQRDATLFVRLPLPPAGDPPAAQPRLTLHALALTRTGRNLSLRYAGEAGAFLTKLGSIGGSHGDDLGPLPASACAALSLNFFNRNPTDLERLKALLPAKDLSQDVLHKLSGPIVLGVAPAPGSAPAIAAPADPAADPDASAAPPIVSLAVRMSDVSVAADLESMMNTLVVLANLKGQEWNAPLVKISAAQHGTVEYHTANLGQAIAARGQRPEMARITLCFGRLGDWYLLTSDQGFFDQCVEVHTSGHGGFEPHTGVGLRVPSGTEDTIATLAVHGPALAEQLKIMAPKMQPRHAQRASVMETIAAMLEDAPSVGIRVWQGRGDEVGGQLDLIRK